MAAIEYTPENLHIRVLFSEEPPGEGTVSVAQEDDRTRVVVLWSGLALRDLVESMIEGVAVALTEDADRGIRYCAMRDNIREAYVALVQNED